MNEVACARVPKDVAPLAPEVDRVLLHHPHFLAADARDYLRLARHAAGREETERSLYWYRKALELWHHANEKAGGRWHNEQVAANREYGDLLLGRGREPAGRA
ncbi:MAG: hypothetical protein AB1578_10120 [Thermodesulfobacteriota bacterium]